ncbi:MAG: hypothetical protein ACE5EA_08080 [Nitrospirota bacterium]
MKILMLLIICMINLLIFSVDPVLSENRISAIDVKGIREEIEYYKSLLEREEEMIENIIKEVREINEENRNIKDDDIINHDLERRAGR